MTHLTGLNGAPTNAQKALDDVFCRAGGRAVEERAFHMIFGGAWQE
jgi:hypothetical protein